MRVPGHYFRHFTPVIGRPLVFGLERRFDAFFVSGAIAWMDPVDDMLFEGTRELLAREFVVIGLRQYAVLIFEDNPLQPNDTYDLF